MKDPLCSYRGESDPFRSGKYRHEEIFNEFGVDIAVWGHVHNYARTFPMSNYTWQEQPQDLYTDPKYPVHVITGLVLKSKGLHFRIDFRPSLFSSKRTFGPKIIKKLRRCWESRSLF